MLLIGNKQNKILAWYIDFFGDGYYASDNSNFLLLYKKPSLSAPFQLAQPSQNTGVFGIGNFGQTQAGNFVVFNLYHIFYEVFTDH